jgi:type I restriction enzyme M protein
MLREMRNAAGDAGEFYTPRPVVRFIIDRLQPTLGEKILDPACGTCGFLSTAYEYLEGEARTPEQRELLQDSIMGIEKKSMPYLLGVVNLLLHGDDNPNVIESNALQTPLSSITDEQRVDIVATNPPFGGQEEDGVLNNFPQGMRVKETALLFFQYITKILKRPGGRCGMVLPDGFLFNDGVAAQIKKDLIQNFNLHTIVRLPPGVFQPYTPISANLVFFDACGDIDGQPCTNQVWYYQIPPPEGRKMYSKTAPLQFEELTDCLKWWDNRVVNDFAWVVDAAEIINNGYNLDVPHPRSLDTDIHESPVAILDRLVQRQSDMSIALSKLRSLLEDCCASFD